MVALSESAPLEHSLTKRHAIEGIKKGNKNFSIYIEKKNPIDETCSANTGITCKASVSVIKRLRANYEIAIISFI